MRKGRAICSGSAELAIRFSRRSLLAVYFLDCAPYLCIRSVAYVLGTLNAFDLKSENLKFGIQAAQKKRRLNVTRDLTSKAGPRIAARFGGIAILLLSLALPFYSSSAAHIPQTAKSRVIVGALVVDGSGRPAFAANVRFVGDRITRVGKFVTRADDEVIQAAGLIVAPGFIDIHNHSESALASEPALASQVSQGITTLTVGPDGGSPWPLADFFAQRQAQPAAVNVIAFVGHATIRLQVMGKDHDRAATDKEIADMAKLVEQGMRDGAVGLSTGLEYDVGHPSTTEEVIELARAAARHGGIYMSHVRDEADDVMNAFKEAIRIGREAHIPV